MGSGGLNWVANWVLGKKVFPQPVLAPGFDQRGWRIATCRGSLAAARNAVSFTSPVSAAEVRAKEAWGTEGTVVQGVREAV